MSSNSLQSRIAVTRGVLEQAFPTNPQLVFALEQLFQTVAGQAGATNPGDLKPFGGALAPDGWLACDGSAVSRSTYSALFGAIGTAWGAGDGASTFNLPNLAGKTLIGASGTYPLGSTGGQASVTLTADKLPASSALFGAGELGLDAGQAGTTAVPNTGGGQPISILPPYGAVTWLIKT